jgi:hypothetical protein
MSPKAIVPRWEGRASERDFGDDLIYYITHESSENSKFVILPYFKELYTLREHHPSGLAEEFDFWIGTKSFKRKLVLPTHVKNEIAGHFNDPEKNKAARQARILWAKMLSDATEVDLDKIEIPDMGEKTLGPDSKFDKQLIAYAIERVKTDGAVVYIATEDGGIMAECAHLLKHKGLNIFTKATRNSCKCYHKPILDEFRKDRGVNFPVI